MGLRTGPILGLALLATACSRAPTLDGLACYPAPARALIDTAAQERAPARDPGGPVAIYLDGSASMAGYIRGGTLQERPLADLVGSLPRLDRVDQSQVSVVRFNRSFATLRPADIEAMKTEAGYVCPAGNPNCDAQESHIDQVLTRVAAADPRSLSIIVSDLWLANSELRTSGGVALSDPLTRILRSRRSIAVYGFESPYSGRVSDLPSGRRDVTAQRRYLFVVVAGPLARVRALDASLRHSSSDSISRDFNNNRARYSLFTLDPVVIRSSGEDRFEVPSGGALSKGRFLAARTGVRVEQLRLDRNRALRADGDPGARWRGIPEGAILPGAVWAGPVRGTTTVYRQVSDDCAGEATDWREDGVLAGGWEAGGRMGYRLDSAELTGLPSGTYLLVGDLRRTSLLSPNPAAQWMQEWSFDSFTETAAIARPVVPTLNLASTARLLENALIAAAEQNPTSVGGFAVAVKID